MKILDHLALCKIATRHKREYNLERPFPHAVIDKFFEDERFEYIYSLFPSPEDDIWKTPSNKHTKKKSVVKKGATGLKENTMGFEACNIFYQLNSATFLNFLEDLTGISGLCPDPYLNEAGFHLSRDGGKLDIHADYSHHDLTGLERRLNVLIYLNKEWQKEFKGSLGLYDENLYLKKSIEPLANRVVIFNTTTTSYHGFPEEIRLKEDYINKFGGRRSIAMYYYSKPTGRKNHRIIFPEDPEFRFKSTHE